MGVYSSIYAHLSEINVLEPSDDNVYLPVANNDPIAPDAIIKMVSCKSFYGNYMVMMDVAHAKS